MPSESKPRMAEPSEVRVMISQPVHSERQYQQVPLFAEPTAANNLSGTSNSVA